MKGRYVSLTPCVSANSLLQPFSRIATTRRHVDLEHGRDVRRGLDRADHVLGDRLAHGVHRLDAALPPGAPGLRRPGRPAQGRRAEVSRPASAGGGRRGGGSSAAVVAAGSAPPAACRRVSMKSRMSLLRHAAAAAGAGDERDVDAVLGGDPGDDGRDEGAPAAVVPCRRRTGVAAGSGVGRALGLGRSLRRRLLGGSLGCRAGGPRCRSGARLPRRRRARSSRAASRRRPSRPPGTRIWPENAARGRGHLGVDLVGRDLEQRLVGGDRIALRLEPLRDRPLRDGHAHLGHHDVDGGSGGHRCLLGQ